MMGSFFQQTDSPSTPTSSIGSLGGQPLERLV
jgi:hypothetical protein